MNFRRHLEADKEAKVFQVHPNSFDPGSNLGLETQKALPSHGGRAFFLRCAFENSESETRSNRNFRDRENSCPNLFLLFSSSRPSSRRLLTVWAVQVLVATEPH